MPRKLPWAIGAATKKDPKTTPQHSRRRDASTSANLVNSDLDGVGDLPSPRRKTIRDSRREPSSSPTSRSPHLQPEVVFMNEGLDADDIYMMVEDEFDHTAHLFTQHIHAAEYDRLKKLHKSRGVETLRNIQRATDGKTPQSRELKIRLEQEEQVKQRLNTRRIAEESETGEDDDPYMQDPQLAGLMAGSQDPGPRRQLRGFTKAKSHTRAAAGYSQSPYKRGRHRDALTEEKERNKERLAAIVADDEADEEPDGSVKHEANSDGIAKRASMGVSQSRDHSSPESPWSPTVTRKRESTGLFKTFAKATDGDPDDKIEKEDVTKYHASPILGRIAEGVRKDSGPSTPSRSRGGIGSRLAQRLAQRQNGMQPRVECPTASAGKDERKPVIKAEAVSPPRFVKRRINSSDDGGKTTSTFVSKHQEMKREDDTKMRRNLNDIPTFLL